MEYDIGDVLRCPKCGSERARIIWKSKDGRTIGIRCPRSGYHHKRNSVILINVQEYKLYLLSPQDIIRHADF